MDASTDNVATLVKGFAIYFVQRKSVKATKKTTALWDI